MVKLQSCVLPLLALVTPSAGQQCMVFYCNSCEAGESTRCAECYDGYTLQAAYPDSYGNQPHCEYFYCEVFACDKCVDGNSKRCAEDGCWHDYVLVEEPDPFFGFENYCEYDYSEYDDKHCSELTPDEEEAYYAKVLVGSIIGAVICLVTVVVMSLPVCCGCGTGMPLIPVAAVCMVIAGVSMFIPLIAGKVAVDGVAEAACDDCGCTEEDESNLKDALSAIGVLVAYTFGGGFIVIILGVATEVLGCCMCCPCCGPLHQMKKDAAGGGQPVMGTVIGQPVA